MIFGIVIAAAGFIFGVMPFGIGIEEEYGLSMLFRMRGPRPAPEDIVIIAIDKSSSDALGLRNDPRKWPRTLHADIVRKTAAAGASGVAFDIFFEEPRQGNEDAVFASAIKQNGRVILCERLVRDKKQTVDGGELYTEQFVPPLPELEEAAIALTPFPLPKKPKNIILSWTFKAGAGDMPTMPAVAFQLYAIEAYDDLVYIMKKSGVSFPAGLPMDRHAAMQHAMLVKAVHGMRMIFENNPHLAERLVAITDIEPSIAPSRKKTINALIKMYNGDGRRYLNFYGPPGTIKTIPYDKILRSDGAELKGKMIFVGFSELYHPEQKDTFYTVFSEEEGRDISGIELAATCFANLLEDMPVLPLSFGAYITIILSWGLFTGIICRMMSATTAAVIAMAASAAYLGVAFVLFKRSGIWMPLVVPVFIQPFTAFFGSLVLKYGEAYREKYNIRKAVGYYLPQDIIDRLAKNLAGAKTEGRIINGICLYTDAEGYTTMAEKMDAGLLGQKLNRYYETVFKPIRNHGGTVSNVVGDSVLALWLSGSETEEGYRNACIAAIEILKEMKTFIEKDDMKTHSMPTRIGVHAGRIMLGNLGAIDHFEYRPVGDIVNATTRLDGLNKKLGTNVLISEKVAEQINNFIIRDVGSFLMVGKTVPMKVYELICSADEATDEIKDAVTVFANALDLFRKGRFEDAEKSFQAYIDYFGNDGPSVFYAGICRQYITAPPAGVWDGTVRIDVK